MGDRDLGSNWEIIVNCCLWYSLFHVVIEITTLWVKKKTKTKKKKKNERKRNTSQFLQKAEIFSDMIRWNTGWFLFCLMAYQPSRVIVMGTYPTIPQRWTRPTKTYSPSLARSGETTFRSLRDIWQTDCELSTASTSFVWLPFSVDTITVVAPWKMPILSS